MLMPSIGAGLAGIVLTAVLLAADWYIWDLRHRISQRRTPELARHLAVNGRQIFHVRSASGRELVGIPAPQTPDRNVPSLEQVQGM
jgi:hypothetical protein